MPFLWFGAKAHLSESPYKGVSRKVVANHTISEDTSKKSHPNSSYATNTIHTTKYTLLTFLPKNLFEQFHRFANLYFLFIQVLNWIPGITAFGKEIQLMPLIFVLSVTAIKDIYEDRRRYRSDKKVNNALCRSYDRKVNRFVKTKWADICVGDIIHLSCDETVCADILILRTKDESGICYVETSNLDGENNLKQRQVLRGYAKRWQTFKPTDFTATIECDPPNSQIYRFNGFITENNGEKIAINKENLLLRDCVLKNTDFADGIVVYAGHETKAMLNNGGPRSKRSKLERILNRDIIWCVVILLLMCVSGSVGYGLWLSSFDNPEEVLYLMEKVTSPAWNGFLVFWTFIILYQVIIPLSLYVTIELIKLAQIYHIHEDPRLFDKTNKKKVFCRALNITEDLGQIEYIFSDKTGTLTENRMIFRRCSIGGIDYFHDKPNTTNNKTNSSSDDDETQEFELNPHLSEELCLMGRQPSNESLTSEYQLSTQNQRILDFFILLAVCNSAVASKHPHRDQLMSASGQYLNQQIENEGNSSIGSPNSRSPSPIPLKPIYESESPDEVALVKAAYRYNVKLLRRNADKVVVSLPSQGIMDFKILNTLPFDSTRKKMSIILRHPKTNEIILYCKGSDSAIYESLAKTNDIEMKQIIEITEQQLNSYSRKGLRTLCMSKRILTEEEYKTWNESHKMAEQSLQNNEKLIMESHNKIEVNLELMGATGIEDSLQEKVPEVIAKLRMAGITIWVLTGDKLETAVNIAFSCLLFTKKMEIIYLKIKSKEETIPVLKSHLDKLYSQGVIKVTEPKFMKWRFLLKVFLFGSKINVDFPEIDTFVRSKRGIVIDGKTLSFLLRPEAIEMFLELAQYCSSILCCRATPLQKASVVSCVKENLNVMTLAIGDGANDVAMIQTADVGIGVSGQEGTQAVMASDFAIPRFLYLERLLLVHGHRSYFRLARTVLYFFYKNATSVFVVFYYQFFCGFSGSVMIDQLYLMIVNAMFTSFPPMILGIYDKDCPSDILINNPHLYSRGRRSRVYTEYSFWVNMFDAAFQSTVMFFIPYICYMDTEVGIYEFGTLIFTAVILQHLFHIAIEFKSWSLLHLSAMTFSVISFLAFAYVYNYLTLGGLFTSDAYMVIQNISIDFKFWISLSIVLIIASLPRYLMRILQTSVSPSSVTKTVQEIYEWSAHEEVEDFLNNIPSKKRSLSAVWTKTTTPTIKEKTNSSKKIE